MRFSAPEGWPEANVQAGFVSDGGSAVLRREGGDVAAELAPLTAAVFTP